MGSAVPEFENRVKKPSYALWRHETELSEIVTPQLIFHLFFVTRKFYLYLITLKFPSYTTREFKFH